MAETAARVPPYVLMATGRRSARCGRGSQEWHRRGGIRLMMRGAVAGAVADTGFAAPGKCMLDHHLRRTAAAFLFVCAMLACAPLQARLHHVKPGQAPELEA